MSTSSSTALVNHVTRMTGAGTSKRGRGGNTPFGCAIPTPSVWPSRCRSTGSTPSMRARRPRLDARKWVLDPYETVTISGWQTSQLEARRFEFTTEARSYGQALGKTANLGVISAVFFRERVPTIMRDTSNDDRGRRMPAPPSSAPREQEAASAAAKSADDEFAATGMGRRTGSRRHAGVAGPRRRTRADGKHPLRIPSAARQARHPASRSHSRSTAAS